MIGMILHRLNTRFEVNKNEMVDLSKYRAVALVEMEGLPTEQVMDLLEFAYTQTQHINNDWKENPTVSVISEEPARSTSVGDLVWVGEDMFVCDSFGWERVSYR